MSTQEYNTLLPYIKIGNGKIAIDSISTIDIENGYSVGHNALWNKLSNEEIVPFFKGLVICEKFVHEGMGYGSATPTKVVYSAILERGLDQDYKIGDWAFRYSSNPYIPVDSGNRHGTSTIYEFFEWQKNYAHRMLQEQEEAIKRKEEKKRLKQEQHAQRLKEKEERDKKWKENSNEKV